MTSALARVLQVLCVCGAGLLLSCEVRAQTAESITLRDQVQELRLYGHRGGPVAIVSSGDGGWMHLGPHVAEVLAAHGYFVVGFDVRAYLSGFTSGRNALRPDDEPGDYKQLVDFAARGSTHKPLLVGVSEGAGLSVLAATDARTRDAIVGVVALGLPDVNELGWRWRDALIYVTHGVPKEPTFSTAAIVADVSPARLAAIHSTSDEFVPVSVLQRVFEAAHDPKRLWIVRASDHRFSDNLGEFDRRLLEAVTWAAGGDGR